MRFRFAAGYWTAEKHVIIHRIGMPNIKTLKEDPTDDGGEKLARVIQCIRDIHWQKKTTTRLLSPGVDVDMAVKSYLNRIRIFIDDSGRPNL